MARASDSARWLGVVVAGELRRQRGELAVGHLLAGQDAPGEDRGVEGLEPRPGDAELATEVLEEADVEWRVVRHEHAAAGELEEARQDLGDARSADDHLVGDAGQHRDVGGD